MASVDSSLFDPTLVFFDTEAATADELFGELEERLSEGGYLAEGWLDAIREREANHPTGLQTQTCALAIPHVDPEFIATPYIAVIRPARPVTFEFMAGMGDPVDAEIIFNLGVMRDGGQVEVLQQLMDIFMDDDAASRILAQTDPADMVAVIQELFAAE